MKWEGLNLHIGNLVPGVATLVLLLALLPKTVLDAAGPSAASVLLGNAYVAAALFVAASYLVGIYTVAICRCVVNTISARWVCPQLLRLSYPTKFKGMRSTKISQTYREATQAALLSDSEYKCTEVKNRRERGRLLRSGMLPMALVVWLVAGDLSVCAKIAIEITAMAIGMFLYAYLELTIYQESVLGQTRHAGKRRKRR